MSSYRIPVCNYPCTALFIDDNRNYLSSLRLKLNTKKISPKLYDNPNEALQFLQDYQPNPFTTQCLYRQEETSTDNRIIDIDVRSIVKYSQNPNRHSQISLIGVDYAMPQLNGFNFCMKIQDKKSFKILMLTAEAGEDKAVEFFNKKIINKFISKDATNFKETLNAAVEELQKEYFLELSQVILDSLTKGIENKANWATDPVFADFFESICKKHNIVEYYLTDEHGSFLLLDINAKPNWLVVKSERVINSILEYAEFEKAPQSIIDMLRSRDRIPYFHTDEDLQIPLAKWEPRMYSAHQLKGKDNYYYAYIDDPNAYNIQPDKVISYQQYLQNL